MSFAEFEKSDMLCSCDPESRLKIANLIDEACTVLGCELESLLSHAIQYLWWQYRVTVSFACDQWFGVHAWEMQWDENNNEPSMGNGMMIECDEAEAGLAWHVMYWSKNGVSTNELREHSPGNRLN